MFNISHKINDRKLTLLECDNEFKPMLYSGNCFLINESNRCRICGESSKFYKEDLFKIKGFN